MCSSKTSSGNTRSQTLHNGRLNVSLSDIYKFRVSDMTSRRRLRPSIPQIVCTFHMFVPYSRHSAGGHLRFLVPPSGTTCLSTSHLRLHSRFSDNDSRPFCFPVLTKTLSYDSCVTITIHHYCLDTCGPCNNSHYLGHVKSVHEDDGDDSERPVIG